MDNETLWEKVEELKNAIGTEALLENLLLALSTDEVLENCEYIDRMQGTDIF